MTQGPNQRPVGPGAYDIVRIGSKRMVSLNQMNQIYRNAIYTQAQLSRALFKKIKYRNSIRLQNEALMAILRNVTYKVKARKDEERINLALRVFFK